MLDPSDLGFPPRFARFRRNQAETILEAAGSTARFTTVAAPPGCGKSATCLGIYSLLSGGDRNYRMAYLVATKALQEQLYADWSPMGMEDLRGHRNYPCAVVGEESGRGGGRAADSLDALDDPEDEDVECGEIDGLSLYGGDYPDHLLPAKWTDESLSGHACVHKLKMAEAAEAPIVVTNYSKWFSSAERLGEFDLLVVDEAHSAVDKVVEAVAVRLNWRAVRALLAHGGAHSLHLPPERSGVAAWAEWARGFALPAAREAYRRLDAREGKGGRAGSIGGVSAGSKRSVSPESRRTLRRLERLGKNLRRFADGVERTPWVLAEEAYYGITLSPVFARDYAEAYLFRGIPRVILSSATPPEPEELGIDRAHHDAIELDSIFSLRRRPFIFVAESPYMRWDTSSAEKSLQVALMDRALEAGRLNRKGIYHTRSYDRARDILGRSRYAQYMTLEREVYEAAPVDAPCVWLTPIAEEGVDMPGAQIRYAFIPKVPFLRTVDSPVQAARHAADPGDRKANVPGYVDKMAARTLEQDYGRVMRHEEDWGECLCFDANLKRLYALHKRGGRLFHKWFWKAWVWCASGVPKAIDFG